MIQVHDTYDYSTVFTQKDVEVFAELTGDHNPLNLDKDFAAKSVFGRQIVQGDLILCAFSKVFATMWPADQNACFIAQEVNYLKPVYIDESYSIKFECRSIDHQRSIGTIHATMKDAAGLDIVKMKARIYSKEHFSAPHL